jgi:tetratricopeptide (TPR) repeat protein
MDLTQITQKIYKAPLGSSESRRVIFIALSFVLIYPLLLFVIPLLNFIPFLSVLLSWVWFTLPGLLLSFVLIKRLSWMERIPISFVLSVGLYTPTTILAILLQLKLTHFIVLCLGVNILVVIIYAIQTLRNQRSQETDSNSGQVVAQEKFESGAYALLVFVIICAGILAFISFQWPPAGDDISGLPIFSEVLRLDFITASEPFHGSGTPSTPRNELITWTYQNILSNRVSGVTPADHFVSTRPILVVLAFLGLYTLLHQFFRNTRIALFLLSFWSVYLLATTRVEGMGSNLITRIFQDKFNGWFVIVPILLVLMLWFLKSQQWRYLIGFSIAALGATLVHPITMTQFMIIGGAFCILYFALDRSWVNFKSLGLLALIIAFCLGILVIQYIRYEGYAPVEQAGLGEAVEFGRIRMAVSRYRLWLLEGDQYILHPAIALQPVILLGYLLLPAMFREIRKNNGARLIVSSMVVFPFILFVPFLANLVGRLVTPYLLWRLAWPLETFAVISIGWVGWLMIEFIDDGSARIYQRASKYFSYASGLIVVALAIIISLPNIQAGMVNLQERFSEVEFSPCLSSVEALSFLDQLSYDEPVNVLASQSLNFCIPGVAPRANVIEYRGLGTINRLPIDEIPASLQRVEDAHYFSDAIRVDDLVRDIINRYEIDYVILEKDRLALNLQLRYLSDMFTEIYADSEVTLYAVADPLSESDIVLANTALRLREWGKAESMFDKIIRTDGNQPLGYYGLGEALEGQGKIDQALAQYIKARDSAENEAGLHSRIAETYLLMNDVDRAAKEYLLALDLQPEIPSLYASLARAYLLAGRNDLAQDNFERAAEFKVAAGSANYYTILAKQMADVGWFSQSIESHQKALELEADPLRHVALGKVYAQLGNTSEAIEQFEKAVEMDPWLFISHLQLGGIYEQQGNHDAAIQEYEKAWRLNPSYNSPFILLGQAIQSKYGTEAAISRLESLVSLNDVIPGPHRGLAPLYVANEQRETALAELDFCAVIQPKDASIQAAIGYLLLASGEINEAQQAYESALFDNPDLISVRMGLSSLYALDAESGPEIGQLYQIIRNEPTLSWPHLSLASAYQRLGMWDTAESEIKWAIKLEPDNPEGYVLLGNLYRARSSWDLAIATFERALEIDPDNTDALVQLAQIHQSRGDLDSAQHLLERAVQINDQDAYALVKLSDVYWSLGLFDKATETKESAVNADPESAYALMLLADSYYQQGRIDEANYLYQRAIQLEPSLIAAYSAEAQLETEMDNNWDAATALFSTAIETNPSSSIAHLVAGRFFQQRGQFDEAESAFQTGLSLPSITADNFLALSDLHLLRGEQESAVDILQRAADAFPAEAKVYNSFAEFYLSRGEIENAQAYYERAITFNTAYVPAYVGLSRIYSHYGDMDKAEQILLNALPNNPSSPEVFLALANFYESQEDYSQAEDYYREAIDIAPAELNNYLSLGQFYQRQRRYDESLELFREAETIPSHTQDLNLSIATSLHSLQQTEEAIRTLEAAIPIDRSDPRPYLALADIYQSQGKPDAALESLRTALDIQPNNFKTQMALGNYYKKLAQFETAKQHFELAASFDRMKSDPLLALGEIYRNNQEWSNAIRILEDAINSSPTEVEVYNELGYTYRLRNLNTAAEAVFTEGIENSFDRSRAYSLRAGFYTDLGRWEQAEADLEKAWEINPNSQPLGMQLANYLISRDDQEGALETLDRLAELPNANYQVQIAKGNIYSLSANWSSATNAFQSAIQMGGETAEAYAGFARIHELQGNHEEALKLYQSATVASPNDPQAFVNLGDAYLEQRDYASAYEAYRKALQLDFVNPAALIQLDNLSRNSNETDMRAPDLHSLASAFPSANLSRTLGYLYQLRGEWNTAEYWYKNALSFDPFDGESWLYLANYHRALENWDQALEALVEGINRQPSSATLLVAKGNVEEKLGQNEEALNSYQKAIEVDPSRIDGYEALASLQIKSGQIDEGLNTMSVWLESAPGNSRGYVALGRFYAEQGQTDLAIETFQAGLDMMPGAADFYVNIGNLYGDRILQVTDSLANAEAFERSVQNRIDEVQNKILPDLNRAQRRVSELKLINALELYTQSQNQLKAAQLAYDNLETDFAAAHSAYTNALEIQPSNEAALMGLGRISQALGETEQALMYYQEAVAVHQNSVIALSYLGNGYLESDNPEAASDVFEDLLLYDPTNTFAHIGLFRAYNAYEQPDLMHASAIVEHGQFTWENLIRYLRSFEGN